MNRLVLSAALIFLSSELASTAFGQDPLSTLSPFGIGSCHSNNWGADADVRWMPKMTAIGITNHRTCNSGWSEVEPEEGKWRWEALDKQMTYLEGLPVAFGGILIGSPKWNAKDKPGTLPVNNLEGWSRYVTELVKHAHGRIKYWEVWNEPPNGTGRDQTPADYAKIVVAAHDAAKAVDTTCLIGLAVKSAAINYLDQVITSGAKGHYDYVTLHPYEVINGVATNIGTDPVYLSVVPTLRKMLLARDPEKAKVPVIFTELGVDSRKGLEVQASGLVKAYVMGIAQGVTCIQWFEGMDGDSGPMGLLDGKGVARPAYEAMGRMIHHFGQHPAYLGWALLNERDYGFVFEGAQGPLLAAWATAGAPDHVEFGAPMQMVDAVSGSEKNGTSYELTTTPLYVMGVPAKVVEEAKTNKGKPIPWGGNYTDAQSVSIEMGKINTERGLHTLSGNAIAEDVVLYGGSARVGSIPGGNVFVVDPNFLSYTSVPIEIKVVVRRNETNTNAGFKLVYESTNGYKNLGWYTVPDNKEWHTISWKITDPQFVSSWGYNFSLDSDGNQYNRYFIQSVTVTKLGAK